MSESKWNGVNSNDMDNLVAEYTMARRDYEAADKKRREAYQSFLSARAALCETMMENHILSQKRLDGTVFRIEMFHEFKANESNYQEISDWLEAVGQQPEEFTSKTIRKARLREFIKGYVLDTIEETGVIPIPPSMEYAQTYNLHVSGWE